MGLKSFSEGANEKHMVPWGQALPPARIAHPGTLNPPAAHPCPSATMTQDSIAELLREKPAVAGAIFVGNAIASTALIRFLFGNVLDFGRFAIRPEMK